ncbi:SMP-30/gluconolactonase/LRE family protein [Asanoa sp. WMMD1127]|uniref:SMP-30/gluconolactonase/LRE family protein n=1 Tax=Asanoa sp. WMMD1127 TaxID=3016107 RepID=UPI0024162C97|nr:SMP-30/gluconolactonase/LRE family protein [Asanoa sp. WMMD1127]MDG4825254.1 SMP-30/gluconolactonase/LRE family protein [Asanoa sp. WMMD1127]
MTDVTVLSDIPCTLGESALWDGSRFYWVDILERRVHAMAWPAGPVVTVVLPDLVGSVALRAGGGLVAALRDAIAFCDVDAGTVEVVRAVDTPPGTRLNDGAVDPSGAFWFGSMDMAERTPSGSFYRLDGALTVRRAFGGIVCSNGPAWSPDGSTLYHVDSTVRLIRAYPVSPSGDVGPGRVFMSDVDHDWFPDGVTVDAQGYVWNCKFGGARIVRYAPDGTVDRVVPLPVANPTRCAFVGPHLDQLAVTSARVGGDPSPLAGQTLLLNPGARGLATPRFAG